MALSVKRLWCCSPGPPSLLRWPGSPALYRATASSSRRSCRMTPASCRRRLRIRISSTPGASGAGPGSPWWVADNGSGKSTLYDGSGAKQGLTVTVGDAPTGLVFNSTTGFNLKDGSKASFLFASEAGQISAWNSGTVAEVEIPSSQDAIFKGLAIAQTAAGPRLYATDFHNQRVDVFEGGWNPVNRPFQFVDPTIPRDYAPFGIQAIGDRVFVTYAKTTGGDRRGSRCGPRLRRRVHTQRPAADRRVAIHGPLNAPWGLATHPPASAASAATARRQLRRRSRQRVQADSGWAAVPPGGAAPRDQRRSNRDRRPLGARVRQRGQGRPDRHALLHRRPERREDGLFGTITPN